jgi:hypothetical protein
MRTEERMDMGAVGATGAPAIGSMRPGAATSRLTGATGLVIPPNGRNAVEVLAALRRAGNIVRVAHDRVFDPEVQDGPNVSQFGGLTTVEIIERGDSIDRVIGKGEAICHPRDRFNRKLGLEIALGRAFVDAFGRWRP